MKIETPQERIDFISGLAAGFLSIAVALAGALVFPGPNLTPEYITIAVSIMTVVLFGYLFVLASKERRRLAGADPK